MLYNCDFCDVSFEPTKDQLHGIRYHKRSAFCSAECRGKWRAAICTTGTRVRCLHCAKLVYQRPGETKKYCSRACQKVHCKEVKVKRQDADNNRPAQRAVRVYKCQHCGNPFTVLVRRGGRARKFCSNSCCADSQRGIPVSARKASSELIGVVSGRGCL